jgi:hypothetical protein
VALVFEIGKEMRADESGSTEDKVVHGCVSWFRSFALYLPHSGNYCKERFSIREPVRSFSGLYGTAMFVNLSGPVLPVDVVIRIGERFYFIRKSSRFNRP